MNRRRLAGLTVLATLSLLGSALAAAGAPAVAKNLVVTPAVRVSLLDAGAAYHQLPVKDYVGLAKGMTYYAAAGLDPSPTSLQAQVGAQDDGGYNLFVRAKGAKKWSIYNDGLGGSEGAKCPITIPSAVLKVWDWSLRCAPPQL